MNDYEIIQKLKRREEEGLRDLMKQYSGYVAAIVCNISQGILSVEDVEELSADVFLSVRNHAAGLMEDRPLRPYLAQTARNTAISRLRKRGEAALPLTMTSSHCRPEKIPMNWPSSGSRHRLSIRQWRPSASRTGKSLSVFTFWVSASRPSADGWP